jgi:hypothetical protein
MKSLARGGPKRKPEASLIWQTQGFPPAFKASLFQG